MDSYFQVRDAERTAWFTSQEVRNIADVAAMVTKALDAAGGEGETSVQALADHGGISLRPISADRFSAQVRDLFCEPPGKLLAELDLKDDTFYCASWVPREEHCVAVSGMISRLLGVYELAMVERLEKHLDLDRFCNEIWDHLHVSFVAPRMERQSERWGPRDRPETGRGALYKRAADLVATYAETAVLQSIHKDWNEDVKARCGLETQSAEEHPQLMAAPEVCKRVCAMSTAVKLDRLNIEVPWLIEQYRAHLHWGRFDQAMDCMEQASALAVAACRRELRQLGMAATEEELAGSLCERIRPHRNRGNLKNRHRELAPQFQSVLALEDAVGLRTQEEKKTLAGRWLELAAAFAGVPIQYEAEQIKQREAQPTLNMELGVTL